MSRNNLKLLQLFLLFIAVTHTFASTYNKIVLQKLSNSSPKRLLSPFKLPPTEIHPSIPLFHPGILTKQVSSKSRKVLMKTQNGASTVQDFDTVTSASSSINGSLNGVTSEQDSDTINTTSLVTTTSGTNSGDGTGQLTGQTSVVDTSDTYNEGEESSSVTSVKDSITIPSSTLGGDQTNQGYEDAASTYTSSSATSNNTSNSSVTGGASLGDTSTEAPVLNPSTQFTWDDEGVASNGSSSQSEKQSTGQSALGPFTSVTSGTEPVGATPGTQMVLQSYTLSSTVVTSVTTPPVNDISDDE